MINIWKRNSTNQNLKAKKRWTSNVIYICSYAILIFLTIIYLLKILKNLKSGNIFQILGNSDSTNLIETILLSTLSSVVTMKQGDSDDGKKEREFKKRGKKRGESQRLKVDGNFTPWNLLPTISYFQINNSQKKVKNLILELFGLKSNYYENEPVNEKVDFNEMIVYDTDITGLVTPINKKLETEIKKLNWIMQMNPEKGFKRYSQLMGGSYEFFLLNLINWKPNWYQELSLYQLVKIIKGYKSCINTFKKELPSIREVWIEDGKKWRVLAIAEPGVRLFLSGLTRFCMYYFDCKLDKKIFHGFMHGRGVTTYWKEIFDNKYLEKEVIIELDFAACFNNIRKAPLIESLKSKYSIPKEIIEIIVSHINAEISQKPITQLPSQDGQIERFLNKDFNLKERNLIQGLPISPLLANLAIKNGLDDLEKEFKLSKEFKYLTYADDISFYLTKDEFEKIGGYNFINKMNNSQSFQKHGLRVDQDKSSVVKDKVFLKDLKLLGLKYHQASKILKSETRGRLENQLKKIKARESTSMDFNFKKVGTNFYETLSEHGKQELKKYLPNYEKIQSLTFESVLENSLLKKYFNTLISYLYKGSEKVHQNFSITNVMEYSILWKVIYQIPKIRKYFKQVNINIHVISYYMIVDLITLLTDDESPNLIKMSHKKILKKTYLGDPESKQIKIKSLLNEFKEFYLYLKLNKQGILGYENYDIDLPYGEIDKFYKKAKRLSAVERAKVLELINLERDETKG